MYKKEKIFCKGYWFYEEVKTGIVIEISDIMYGTGDMEDDIEIREDKIVKCYYIWSAPAGIINEYTVGLGCYKSIIDAKNYAEKKCGKIVWE
jgi:hypothetical protein